MQELTAKNMTIKQIQQDASQRYQNYLSTDTIRYRLKKGWDLDRVEQTKPDQRPNYFLKGRWYSLQQIQQIAHSNGVFITDRSFRRRLERGMSLNDAIRLPAGYRRLRNRKIFPYQGKDYSRVEIIALAKQQYQKQGYLSSELAISMFALHLIDYMQQHNLTITQLANKTNLGKTTICEYIRCKKSPNLVFAIHIANCLGTTLNDLISIPDR